MKDCSNIFFITDLDGTLLPPSKGLNPDDLAAIERFRKAGGHFSIATGRALQSAAQYFGELKPDEPIIVYNGGAIYDCAKKEFVWQKLLDPSAADIVRAVYEKFPYMGMEADYSDRILVPRLNPKEQYHLDISYSGMYTLADISEISPDNCCKVLFADESVNIPPLMEFIDSMGNEKLVFVRSSPYFYEILPKDCTKGSALLKINELYPLYDRFNVACGDFDNDLEMLKNADFAVCPANAQDCVKEISGLVTKADCAHGAVAEAIEYVMNL